MSPEFNLIARFFTRPARRAVLGVGDDCALLSVAAGLELAVSTDTLVSGTHFFADADAGMLGHKALAVNLSDLAAMGAKPRYATLALTLPAVDEAWLAAFARGFFALADRFDVELIGGDTTGGPLSMTLTVFGEVEAGRALRRDGARPEDGIWVSGDLGGAARALGYLRGVVPLEGEAGIAATERLHRPEPRVALGESLRGLATAAIDVSDGLVADLQHICERSSLGAQIEWSRVPLHPSLRSARPDQQMAWALSGGDDYELCFTAPASAGAAINKIAQDLRLPLTRIGAMHVGAPEVTVRDTGGRVLPPASSGFDHFSPT